MRRQPKQDRSAHTVEKIKAAMRQIIEERSYSAATTNEIARRAGVNISSLYFFFPNREAIARALYETTSLKIAKIAHAHVLENMTKPLEESLASMVRGLVSTFDKEQLLLLRLIEQVPEARETASALEQERLGYQIARLWLEHQLGPLDEETIECKMFFMQHVGFDMIRRYIVKRPSMLSEEQFVTELSRLLSGYLKAPASKKRAAGTFKNN